MKQFESTLVEILKGKKGTSLTLELDADSYLETNIKTIKLLEKNSMSGVYVSIQRPGGNISSLLKDRGVDLKKIIFVDVATAAAKEIPVPSQCCVHISPELDIDELCRAIYTSLEKLKGKRFIFIDSLTTLALYKPISETLRFSDFLMNLVKGNKDLIVIFNVAKDLAQKKFIRDVIAHADKTIEVKP